MVLMASATGVSSPNGPHLLGPTRFWKRAKTRRSNQMNPRTPINTALMTTAMIAMLVTRKASHCSPSGKNPSEYPRAAQLSLADATLQ